jgi:hypothetical protein
MVTYNGTTIMSSQCLELKSLKRSETSILKSLGYKSVFPLDAQLNLPADQYTCLSAPKNLIKKA